MGLMEKAAATEFIGLEFATWLYWQSEKSAGKLRLQGLDEFDCWFEAPVELTAEYGDATVITLKGGAPLESPEARRALLENKKINKAHLRIIWQNQTFTFALRASNFAVSGLKLPVPPKSGGDYLDLRFEMFEAFEKFWGQVLEHFLTLRLNDKAWRPERKRMSDWVKSFEGK